ncbi:hypothetical protein [Microbulbifer litoralis]|uniref:hypothetical protein n=1 Tax=Microbulbifer litoralis TaxID=2933965 RepID=UPI00202857F3|nr:hypothetical protein [Microbulbifer sp. GX H0434]
MCAKKVTDLESARKFKREKRKWTTEEVRQQATKDLKRMKGLSKKEPKDLVSGDMDKAEKGTGDDE